MAKTCKHFLEIEEAPPDMSKLQKKAVVHCVKKWEDKRDHLKARCMKKNKLTTPLDAAGKETLKECMKGGVQRWKECHKQCRAEHPFEGKAWKASQEQKETLKKCTMECAKAKAQEHLEHVLFFE